jgi:serine phosphatase RsbU (regulator of sigma subunit)/anti-sigma regulatory factor (Ser/Thr protein kinase)
MPSSADDGGRDGGASIPAPEPRYSDRPAPRRYGVALLLTLGAVALFLVLLDVADGPLYAPLVGVVPVVVMVSGLGPAFVSVAAGWAVAFVVLVEPVGGLGLPEAETDAPTRWAVNLAVALGVVWVTDVMRRGRKRAAVAAATAEASIRDMSGMQDLAAALSAAVTPSDVAHALIERTPALLGARGGALGLIEGDVVAIVDPQGVGTQTHQPGLRLPLSARAPIAEAARLGSIVRVPDRETFERDYPDGAALTLYAHGAVAVPVREGREVVGALSLLFGKDDTPHEEADAIALLAAQLGGQALERAQLYARERESREGLDRILRVSPRFHTDSLESATAAICTEARRTFGSDFAILWRLRDHQLELVASDPQSELLPDDLVADLADFPTLLDAVDRLTVSFVSDVQEEARATGLERTRRLGIHSSLRVPIAIGGGDAQLVLIVSWDRVVSEPDDSTIALLRRFADQAGFALEQVERRRAQAEAATRAEETRRLQEITAALSTAATAADVSTTCVEHALTAVGAEAGFIVLSRPGVRIVELVASKGYSDADLEVWRGHSLDSDVPYSRAIASGEAVWALTPDELASFKEYVIDGGDAGWVALPLRTGSGTGGALHLSFRRPRTLSEAERRWLQTVVSQCAQALERSRLFDEEQLLRRRSERLQSMTAELSNALTRSDVADVVVEQLAGAVGAAGVAVAVVAEERQLVQRLASRGYGEDVVESFLDGPLDAATPANHAIRRRVSSFYESVDALAREFPAVGGELEETGHASFFFVPLVVGRRAAGLLVMSWDEPYLLSNDERRFLEALAGQAAQALARATHLETEQTIAETLQRSVLPATLPRIPGAQIAARYLPGTAELDVGGDWYDVISLPDERIGLVVGDVVGKGVEAAAAMSQLRNGLRAFSLERLKPASALARLNRLAGESLETTFATLTYAVVDPRARICRLSSAGHPPPVIAYADGRVELLEGGRGVPLGVGPATRYRQMTVELPLGSILLLYSDGLVERRGQSIDDGLERLRRAVAGGPRKPERLVDHVVDRLVGSTERADDIALLAFRLFAVAPEPLELRIPSDVDSLELVRDSLRVWLEGTPASATDADDLVLAAWEACANAVEHGHEPEGGHVRVHAALDDSAVTIVVEDTGRWTPPTERTDRGFGLQLMHALMSSVDIVRSGTGTRVTLEKRIAGAD